MKLLALLLLLPLAGALDPQGSLASSKVEQRRVLSELTAIERQQHEVAQELEAIQQKIEAMEGDRAAHEAELEAAEAAVVERARALRDRVRVLYRLSRTGFLSVLFSAEDPADLRRRSKYLVALLAETRAQIQDYLDEARAQREALSRVEDSRASLLALHGKAEARQRALEIEAARHRQMLKDIERQKDLALQVLAERARASEALPESMGSITLAEPAARSLAEQRGDLPWPVRGRLMRAFGPYRDPLTGRDANNMGIDIRAAAFTPVRAVADGYVQYAAFIDGYGLTVVVQHDPTHATVYANLGDQKVAGGQEVRAGDIVGTVGETGVTDGGGPRLHFEVRIDRQPVDPYPWLGAK